MTTLRYRALLRRPGADFGGRPGILTLVPGVAPLSAAIVAATTLLTPATAEGQSPLRLPAGQETTASATLLRAIDLYTGVAGRVDDAEARSLLEEAARDADDVLARMWIARVHSRGRMTFEHDEARARALGAELLPAVRELAAAGDVEAAFLMGTVYDEGLGVSVDYPEAMRWYRRAAHQGHVLAVHNIGNMHRDGRGVDVDPPAAIRWWLRAARAGDAIPALRLGEAFERGWGVVEEPDRARFWYRQAAEKGNEAAADGLRRLTS